MAVRARSSELALGPPKQEKYLPVITFRCPNSETEWMGKHVLSSGQKLSQVVVWAVKLGHEYYDLLEPLNDRVEEIMRSEGLERSDVVSRLLKAGLAAHKKK